MSFKKSLLDVSTCIIAQMKEGKKLYKMMKKFGGGGGGRKGVKFHFEVFRHLYNRKIRGIS